LPSSDLSPHPRRKPGTGLPHLFGSDTQTGTLKAFVHPPSVYFAESAVKLSNNNTS